MKIENKRDRWNKDIGIYWREKEIQSDWMKKNMEMGER